MDLAVITHVFKRTLDILPSGQYRIEGEAPMTETEVKQWINCQATVQCPHCGAYRRESQDL